MRKLILSALVIFGSLFLSPLASADKDAVYTGWLSNTAVQGYDVVAYFDESKAVEGDSAFTTEYQGADFQFKNQENLDKFLADPAAYAPQYGGYCAWAVSQGYTAKGNAKNWSVVDGKLYLNYNTKVQTDWKKDIPGFIESANQNWPKVLE